MTNDKVRNVSDFLRVPLTPETCTVTEHKDEISDFISQKDQESYLLFMLDKSFYALPTLRIVSIINFIKPQCVPFIRSKRCLGFHMFRGRAIPLLDIHSKLGLRNEITDSKEARVVIFEFEKLYTGIIVNSVCGVRRAGLQSMPWESSNHMRMARISVDRETALVLTTKELTESLGEAN